MSNPTKNRGRVCAIEECDRAAKSRGWCQMHYARYWRRGDPNVVLQLPVSADPVCSVRDCSRPTWARGWCSKHYKRWAKHSDPEAATVRPKGMTAEEAFRYVMPGEPPGGECWVWQGAFLISGYGQLKVNGRTLRVHKLAYMIYHGQLPPGAVVPHTCDNPPCVNPRHLVSGSVAENNRDRARRNRSHRPAGETNPAAKLTAADIVAIRVKYSDGGISQRALGIEFGITQTVVSGILQGRSWSHVISPEVSE